MEAIVILSAISYLWHAFMAVPESSLSQGVDGAYDELPSDVASRFVNSMTILDGHDNVFNEDFHFIHHHFPEVHWTDAPAHYRANQSHYEHHKATLFSDTEQGLLIKWLLTKNWDKMADHFVDISGKLSHSDKKDLIISRLRLVVE